MEIGGKSAFSSTNSLLTQTYAHRGLYSAIVLRAMDDTRSKNRVLREEAKKFLKSKEATELLNLLDFDQAAVLLTLLDLVEDKK